MKENKKNYTGMYAKKTDKKAIILITLLIVFVATVAFCVLYLFNYYADGATEANRYNELANMKKPFVNTNTNTNTNNPTEETYIDENGNMIETPPRNTVILPEYKSLYEQNNDLVGWINIPDTVIDYPVVQSAPENANYYLTRNFDKVDSGRGCIYARETCDVFTPSDNVTIFGHNFKDGSMFRSLSSFAKKDRWEQGSTFTFDTIYEHHTYQIFAVFRTSAFNGRGFEYEKYENMTESEFNAFVESCKNLQLYDTGIIPTYGDKLLCLSTCEYTIENGRLVVAAVQIA